MPSSRRTAQAWAGDLSANRSALSTASSCSCSPGDSAAGCAERGPGILSCSRGLRCR